MSTTPALTTPPTIASVATPVFSAAKTPAPAKAAIKKPGARKAAMVPSKAVIAKAAPKTPAVKTPPVKVTAKAAVKKPVTTKLAATPAAKPVKVAPPAPAKTPAKPKVTKKPKLVRDSFTIPKAEYVVLEDLKQRAAGLAQSVKKSELLRAGIKALAAMSDTAFRAALNDVPAIKTGRPASDK